MKHVAIARADGGVSVMTVINDDASIEEEIKKWETVGGACVAYAEIQKESIPTDREFRNAWTWRFGKIDHDLVKAREIHLDRIRKERNEALKALDVEMMKAVGVEDKARMKDVAKEQQRLRDIPQTLRAQLDAAKDISELKMVKADIGQGSIAESILMQKLQSKS